MKLLSSVYLKYSIDSNVFIAVDSNHHYYHYHHQNHHHLYYSGKWQYNIDSIWVKNTDSSQTVRVQF